MNFVEKEGKIFVEGTEQEIENLKTIIAKKIIAKRMQAEIKCIISEEINKIKNYFLSILQNSIK